MGLHGPRERREKEPGGGRVPLPLLVRIGQGKGGGAPPFLPLFLLFPPSPTPTWKEGVLLPVGVGLPPWRALLGRRPPTPFDPLYTGEGGHPIDTTIDH